jgi:hypothetical protein
MAALLPGSLPEPAPAALLFGSSGVSNGGGTFDPVTRAKRVWGKGDGTTETVYQLERSHPETEPQYIDSRVNREGMAPGFGGLSLDASESGSMWPGSAQVLIPDRHDEPQVLSPSAAARLTRGAALKSPSQ